MKGRRHDDKHLRFIRTLPCLKCGNPIQTEAAHYRRGDARIGKLNPGQGQKPDDRYTVPLCSKHHAEQTRIGEYAFWHLGPDPLLIALALYSVSGDNEAGEKICEAAFRSWPPESTERLGKHGEKNDRPRGESGSQMAD